MTLPAQAWACAVEVLGEVPVVEFRILGAVHLLGAAGRALTSVLAQPKRVALLAYLAAATPRRLHRRDSLIALFWPELDQEHARAALRQALHGLRHALGDGVLVSRGDEDIGLDDAQIRCDVVEFERAAEAGRLADALDLYRGDLLEGFFIRGAPAFEQWLEDERVRLKVVALRSATVLAERGGCAESVQWGRRALRISPLDEPTLRRLMQTLDRLGDRAGALEAYEAFAKRLATELEAEPAPETRMLAGAVRERVATLASAATELAPLETGASATAGAFAAANAPAVALAPVSSGASSVAADARVATRSRTAPASIRVSGAGSASSSVARRFANASYASSAPARSPSRSSVCIKRRNVGSSSGEIRSARRPHCTDSAQPPRSASTVALRSATTFSRTRSSSSHCSNAGAPRMKNPSSRSPR